jgi:hypothetical protein
MIKSYLKYFVIFSLLFPLNSCTSTNSPSEPGDGGSAEIIGSIIDSNGNMVDDVSVYLIYLLEDPVPGLDKVNNTDSVTSSISQNFPNPFFTTTNIAFELTAAGYVNLYLTPFDSGDTLKSFMQGNLNSGFYALQWSDPFVNQLYLLKLHLEVNQDSVHHDQVFILRNNSNPDSLISSGEPNLETLTNRFTIKTKSLPLKGVVAYTKNSPNIIEFKTISETLVFVLSKTGYKTLVDTQKINMTGTTNIIFTMEAD